MARKGFPPVAVPDFDVPAFLRSANVPRRVARFPRNSKVFAQGTSANAVFYIQEGWVKLSVLSSSGKEAVVAMLGMGDFFGESCLTGHAVRAASATTVLPTTVVRIPKRDMLRALRDHSTFADCFIAHLVDRNIRIEEALVDQLFHTSEERLARTLLTLARYGFEQDNARVLPKLSQETLAEMVGTTRSRVNFFMNKFRRLGFVEYNGELKIYNALLGVFARD